MLVAAWMPLLQAIWDCNANSNV